MSTTNRAPGPIHTTEEVISSERASAVESSGEVLDLLSRRKWVVLLTTATITVAAALTAWTLPDEYQASVLIAPLSGELGSGRAAGPNSPISLFGSLSSLAGIAIPGGGTTAESLATLQSSTLTERFIQENNLLPVLYSNKWSSTDSKWKMSGAGDVPTLWKADAYFARHVRSVVENNKTGLVTLSITWTDPKLAAQWANKLVQMTNDYLRDKAIRESERNIAYLRDQASKTTIVEVQKAIYSLMEGEIRKVMMARGSDEYALRVIDRALVPERPVAPRRVLWLGAGFFGGFFGAAVAIIAYNSVVSNRRRYRDSHGA